MLSRDRFSFGFLRDQSPSNLVLTVPFPFWSSETTMSSPSEERGELSSGASCFVRTSVKSAIKALSSTRFLTYRDRDAGGREETEWHDRNLFTKGSSSGTAGDERIASEIPSELEFGLIEPEVRLAEGESALAENVRSKMSKIRSMYGNDAVCRRTKLGRITLSRKTLPRDTFSSSQF